MDATKRRGLEAAAVLIVFMGCSEEAPISSSASTSASGPSASAASASASVAVSATADPYPRARDDLSPVYPKTDDPADPRAERYCNSVFEVSEAKRRECCPQTSFTPFRPTAECVRTLSAALRSGALEIASGSLEACEAAATEAAKTCDGGAEMPPACENIFKGTRAATKLCRSALECTAGLQCKNLGVTSPGQCAQPEALGERCGAPADSLASFVRQSAEVDHPICVGACAQGKCAAVVADGGACSLAAHCGAGLRCRDGKCTAEALPGAGKACEAGACARGHRCVGGTCSPERRIGESCAKNEECRSGHCEGGACKLQCGLVLSGSASAAGSSPPR